MSNFDDLKVRMKKVGLNVIALSKSLPVGYEFEVIRRQIIRCSTSVGANYRAACRAKSGKDFVNKLKIVEEELDETQHWMEMIRDLTPKDDHKKWLLLDDEVNQLLAITVSSINTARKKKDK